MKHSIVFLLTILLTSIACFAQTENPLSQKAITALAGYYNSGQPDSIFNMFSPETQKALPLEKTIQFIKGLQQAYGSIRKTSFARLEKGFNAYKTDMERGTLQLSIAVNETGAITGVYAKPWEEEAGNVPARNTTPMQLPFSGEWTVFWGGDTKEQNYHVVAKMQKNAFDIIITDTSHKSYRTNGVKNEDYYAFGQNLTAPCDAEVVFAVDGVKDNVPGSMNPMYTLGNSIFLKTARNEYILMAHFKQGTVTVKQGDKVKTGQLLGQCGNSGNSSEPHLHFHIQHTEDFNKAVGIKCYFDKVIVNNVEKTDYSPVKNERIKK